jgi:molybdenum cofactor cytidylyltransferase
MPDPPPDSPASHSPLPDRDSGVRASPVSPNPVPPPSGIAAVVLAAGASQRLGEPKQLIQVAGESLLRCTARLAIESGCAPVTVVLGFRPDRMAPELEGLNVQTVLNSQWTEGMGASLRTGVAAAVRSEVDGLLVLVCDQPRLTAAHLHALLALHRQARPAITASLYAGRPGVPAIFAPSTFSQLLAVRGDRGARDVIREFAASLQTLPWPDGAMDVDSPADVQRLREP